MRRLVVATNNAGKVAELMTMLGGIWDEVLSLKEAGLELHVVEDGLTFEENAVKKARAAAKASGCDALADDSGLCVDVLGDAPGIYSARWAGEDATDEKNNRKLLEALRGAADRSARFVCAVALASEDGVITARGEVRGVIAHAPSGSNGFGYDPLFFVPELGQTFAEVPADVKNTLSHRARAVAALRDKLLGERE